MMTKCFDVFWRFLLLGCVSFGGPAAHIGYFRQAFVEKRQWLTEDVFAKQLALSQFLPGPGSSQLGFSIGMHRAGLLGGCAAFLGFTLPSFLLLFFIATVNVDEHTQGELGSTVRAVLHGLKLLAVVVVADAAISMYKSFCQTKITALLAALSASLLLCFPALTTQMCVLLGAALVGVFVSFSKPRALSVSASGTSNAQAAFKPLPLIIFISLLVGLPFAAAQLNHFELDLFSNFYHAGSLVFGGGHVVLPLLQQSVGDALPADQFILGYAAAQAVPGPMFTLATFLGAELSIGNPFLGALLATLGIFLPGFLLLVSLQGVWQVLAEKPQVAGAVLGVNAAVVGLLIAALYYPVFTHAVYSPTDMAAVIVGLLLLRVIKLPIVYLVAGFGLSQVIFHYF